MREEHVVTEAQETCVLLSREPEKYGETGENVDGRKGFFPSCDERRHNMSAC